jgi:hypothetical protein
LVGHPIFSTKTPLSLETRAIVSRGFLVSTIKDQRSAMLEKDKDNTQQKE